ncbi:MAG: hypothetical protein ABL876_05225 [Chitinophagaceae bacterium]
MKILMPSAGRYDKSLNTVFGTLAIGLVIVAAWLTFSEQPLANRVNLWQANLLSDNTYYPALTIFILALPPLIVLMFLKLLAIKILNSRKRD